MITVSDPQNPPEYKIDIGKYGDGGSGALKEGIPTSPTRYAGQDGQKGGDTTFTDVSNNIVCVAFGGKPVPPVTNLNINEGGKGGSSNNIGISGAGGGIAGKAVDTSGTDGTKGGNGTSFGFPGKGGLGGLAKNSDLINPKTNKPFPPPVTGVGPSSCGSTPTASGGKGGDGGSNSSGGQGDCGGYGAIKIIW